jgi:pilus assembly protein Flp/PilA
MILKTGNTRKPNTKQQMKKGELKMIKRLVNFFKEEDGASMVEYGLLVALIAVVCIVAIGFVGTNLNTVFTNVAAELQGAVGGGGGS